MRLSAPLILAVVAVSSGDAATLPGTFQQIDCEGAGWFEQIVPHISGRLYGRTDVGGMYRSDDHGDSWKFLSGDLQYPACYNVQGVAVAAGNADVVYQACGVSYSPTDPGRGVWKSINGGSTWTQVLSGVNFSGNDDPRFGGECLVIQPGNDNEIWAGSRANGLRRSTNAGTSWTEVSPGTFGSVVICGITIHPSAPDTIWVCGDGGVWVSTNHGSTWTYKITATRIYKVVVKADGTAFAAGTNGGANVLYQFTITGSPTNLYPAYVSSLPYEPYDGDEMATVQLLANGDLYAGDLFENTAKSTNEGASFTRLPLTLTGTLPAFVRPGTTTIEGGRNGLIQDPTDANRLFLGGGYSPFRSKDGGATWAYINKGVGEAVPWRATFHPTDANRIWFPLADLGCTTVSDGGASGASNGYIAPKFPYPDDNVMFTHRVMVSANKVIAPGGEQTRHRPRIYQSTDNGANWSRPAANGLPTTADNREIVENVQSADLPDDYLVFLAGAITNTEGGIYRTTDGGDNFTRSTGLPTTLGYDAGAEFYWNVSLERDAGSDSAIRYALLRGDGNHGDGFYKSANRGASWTRTTAQPSNFYGRMRVDAVSGRIWVGNVLGLEYSVDKGGTWTSVSGLASVTELDAHNGRVAVIGRMAGDTTDHIYVSANNGGSWDEVTRAGNRFATAAAIAVDPYRAGTLWISTGGRSVARFTPAAATPIDAWRTQYFGSAAATGNAAPGADGDSDGIPTLAEYGYATNPIVANATRPWQVSKPTDRIAITFPRNTAATDLTFTVQGADNLTGSWTNLARSTGGAAMAALVSGVTVAETGADATRSVEVRDLYAIGTAAHPQRFLRVTFTLSP